MRFSFSGFDFWRHSCFAFLTPNLAPLIRFSFSLLVTEINHIQNFLTHQYQNQLISVNITEIQVLLAKPNQMLSISSQTGQHLALKVAHC